VAIPYVIFNTFFFNYTVKPFSVLIIHI